MNCPKCGAELSIKQKGHPTRTYWFCGSYQYTDPFGNHPLVCSALCKEREKHNATKAENARLQHEVRELTAQRGAEYNRTVNAERKNARLIAENARLRDAAKHCRLFIADRTGYHAKESDERKNIIAELDDILANASSQGRREGDQ